MRSAIDRFRCQVVQGLLPGVLLLLPGFAWAETAPELDVLRQPDPGSVRTLPPAFSKPSPASASDLRNMERHVTRLVDKVSEAVVSVEVGGATGSGVVVSADGLVLTAGHVANGSNRQVKFTFPDGKTVRGKTLGADEDSDCGIARITDPGPWPFVDLAGAGRPELGTWVLAMGHPGGFDPKRSLVVRLGRVVQVSNRAVQTDCTITTGDPGGPLFDMHGRVLAIHSFISNEMVDNYHISVSKFYDQWDALVRGTNAPRASVAYLGAEGVDDDDGCRIETVRANSPADRAGLKEGDIVTKIDGRDVRNAAMFRRWVTGSQPGDTLDLEVKRGEETLSFSVRLGSPRRRS